MVYKIRQHMYDFVTSEPYIIDLGYTNNGVQAEEAVILMKTSWEADGNTYDYSEDMLSNYPYWDCVRYDAFDLDMAKCIAEKNSCRVFLC